MKNIDKVEFEWHNIECLDPKMITELINSKGMCLVVLRDGDIKVVEVEQSDRFLAIYNKPWGEYYFHSKDDADGECFDKIKEFAKHEEFILYSVDVLDNNGDFDRQAITMYDDVIEIASLPNNPIVYALINFM